MQMWLARDELMWRQCFKALWLKEGDKSSRFFHLKASIRRKRNSILKLRDVRGEWVHGDGKDKLIVDYCGDLFSTASHRGNMDFLSSLHGRVTSTMNESLTAIYTEAEVVLALKFEGSKARWDGPYIFSTLLVSFVS